MKEHKPDLARQCADPMTQDERDMWFWEAGKEMQQKGAKEVRASVDDEDSPTVCLVEGWLELRYGDVPPPFFFETAKP